MCDYACPGDDHAKCGGHWMMNVYQIAPAGDIWLVLLGKFSNLFIFQLTAPGATGLGRAVPKHADSMGLRMGLGPFLSLLSMEARNAKDLQQTFKIAT